MPLARPTAPFFDVIATHVETGSIKILAADKSQGSAEALLERVLLGATSGSVVYAVVPAGSAAPKGRFPSGTS
jgi:uncharacterized protein (DUF1501 family)